MEDKKRLLRYYSEVTVQEVQWLWFPYIPLGKLTLIQGDPGDGKTTLLLHIASLLSRGAEMPYSKSPTIYGNSIYQSIEDSPGDTIKPRLIREGADCGKIAFLQSDNHPLTLLSDEWEDAIRQTSAQLLVIDPLQGFLGRSVNMQLASDMRQAMQHLSKVAETTSCAIVVIGHMNKSSGSKGLYRGLGSIDIVAAARSVLLLGRSPEDSGVRLMAQVKNSLEREGPTLAFELMENQGIRWIGEYDMTVEDILYSPADLGSSKLDIACDELKRVLSSGSRPCNEVYEALEASNLSKRTIDHAKKILNVASTKQANEWYWSLTKGI